MTDQLHWRLTTEGARRWLVSVRPWRHRIDSSRVDGIKIRFVSFNTISEILIINWLSFIRLSGLRGASLVFTIIVFSVQGRPLKIKWSVAIGFHNQLLPVHYTSKMRVAWRWSLWRSGVSENITELSMKKRKKKPPYSLMSFRCGLSQCQSVGAKLLIEFDGASAALWNDVRWNGPFPLPSYLCAVSFALSYVLAIYITLSRHGNIYMMDCKTDDHTHQLDPGMNYGSLAASQIAPSFCIRCILSFVEGLGW